MKQEVFFHHRVRSYNEIKNLDRNRPGFSWALDKEDKKETLKALAHLSRPTPADGPFVVTLTRISPGYLDSDGLMPGFKAIRDVITEWVGLRDDGIASVIKFEYRQQGCPLKEYGCGIAIEDQRDGDDRRVILSGVPALRGDSVAEKLHHRAQDVPKPLPRQVPLPLKQTVLLELPWLQTDVHRTIRTPFEITGEPPTFLNFMVPTSALACEATARLNPGTGVSLKRTARRKSDGSPVFVYTWEK